jgi:hypothetical protein
MEIFEFEVKGAKPILIEVKITDKTGADYEGVFVLDTGTKGIIAKPIVAQKLGYDLETDGMTAKVSNSTADIEARAIQAKSITALGHTVKNSVIVFSAYFNPSIIQVDGFIGRTFLLGKELCIDFKKGVIRLKKL